MAKQVIWSIRAQRDRKNILKYWLERNKSNLYSKKLDNLFKDSIRVISEYPQIGVATDDSGVRIKVVRDYLIIYEEMETQILVLTIWDRRQDPGKLKKILD